MNILGISYMMHESSACLVQDGELVFAVAEERLSRKNKDGGFPVPRDPGGAGLCRADACRHRSRRHRLAQLRVTFKHNVKTILKGDWPSSWQRRERTLMQLVHGVRHRGGAVDYRRAFGTPKQPVHFVNHHLAHALSSYLMSGFDETAVLVVDGRGAEEATTLWHAKGNNVHLLEKYKYPDSLGVFYAGITAVLGFVPFSDEWKVMGLASYGEPTYDLSPLIRAKTGATAWKAGGSSAARTGTTAVWPRSSGRAAETRNWTPSTRTWRARPRKPARRRCSSSPGK